jgi:hypothetical protein
MIDLSENLFVLPQYLNKLFLIILAHSLYPEFNKRILR